MKSCKTCGQVKSLNSFYKRASSKDGLNATCKECQKPIQQKAYFLRKFSLTIEAYELMLLSQQGVCLICGKCDTATDKFGNTKALAVHHCHKTGDIICLLCFRCNTALGMLNDDPDLLQKAADLMRR